MDMPRPTKLQWFNSYASNQSLDRSTLNKVVMRKVALRRKLLPQKPYPKSRQFPVFMLNDGPVNETKGLQCDNRHDQVEGIQSQSLHSDAIESADPHTLTDLSLSPALGGTCPPILAKFNLDFLDLSILASNEVGQFNGLRVLEHPKMLPHFIGKKTWSYCHQIPRLYSQSILIRNADDCAVARARSLLSPFDTQWESLTLSSYAHALSRLQEAVDLTSQHPTVEVLCATQILALYEVCCFYILSMDERRAFFDAQLSFRC